MASVISYPRPLTEFLDIIILICDYLFPYDVLSLSNTCKSMRMLLMNNKSVWLQVANNLSHCHPLPFTHISTADISDKTLRQASLRAQRVSKKWIDDVIHPSELSPPSTFSFPDKRSISYLAFLPGARHLLIIDTSYNISCWTNGGVCLATWNCPSPAELARWKPMEADKCGVDGVHSHLIEIMLHQDREDDATFYAEIISLQYTPTFAEFKSKTQVYVPDVYWPMKYSFMQEDLYGVLVTVEQGRSGLYLVSGKLQKAICLDIGEEFDLIVQVLTSPKHIVLYWEVEDGAQAVTYDTPALLHLIETQGYKQKHQGLETPVSIAPSATQNIYFKTILKQPVPGQEDKFEDVEVEMARSPAVYPVIIPKWATLHEKFTDHRVRSIMSLSRRRLRDVTLPLFSDDGTMVPLVYTGIDEDGVVEFEGEIDIPIHYLPPDANTTVPLHVIEEVQQNEGADEPPTPPPINDAPLAATENPDNTVVNVNNDFDVQMLGEEDIGFEMDMPYTTITHYYWDYNAHPEYISRTVLANVRLRRLPAPGGSEAEERDANGDLYDELPIMGYGGRCALWVEEVEDNDVSGNTENTDLPNLVMRLVTFPAYNDQPKVEGKPSKEGALSSIPKISTISLPPGMDINEAVSLDLDDALGLVAIATKGGDIWVIDYS